MGYKGHSIRNTDIYKQLTPFKAMVLAHKSLDKQHITDKQLVASWQYIYDVGLSDKLPHVYRDKAYTLLKAGVIKGTEY